MKKEEGRVFGIPFCRASFQIRFLHSSFCNLDFPMNDLKFAIRQLLKNPGFTAAALLQAGAGRRVSVRECL